jgi:membrane-associated phospholipid phosphatase
MKHLLITISFVSILFIQIDLAQDSTNSITNSSQANSDSIQTIKDSSQIIPQQTIIRIDLNPEVDIASPYHTSFKKDAPVIIGGVGITALGVYLIQNKKALEPNELINKTKDKIPFFDRSNTGFYSKKANDASYIPFETGFAMPILFMLVNKNERQKFGQIFALYTETMAITGAMFTITAGTVNRSRPLVYGTAAPPSLRLAAKSQRAFYAGHTAATAAATFFAARVFQDFKPDSKANPYIWTVAAIVPAVTGYLRYKAGMHFLSDNLLGYILGASTGILIPKWHKNKVFQKLNIMPEAKDNYKGVTINYRF